MEAKMEESMIESTLEQTEPVEQAQPDATREEWMIDQTQWGAILNLKSEGCSKKKMARLLNLDVRTVRKYLRQGGWKRQKRKEMQKLTDPYQEYLMQRMSQVDYNAQVLYQELRERGYAGSYSRVKEFVRPHRQERERLIEATLRFERAPGKQAQVDWGSTTVEIGGKMTRVQVFVMVMGYSRRIFATARLDQKVETLVDCHQDAFDHFGGRTKEILYDNPKTICLRREGESQTPVLNPVFEDFALYWGLAVKLCQPYRARTKGKVESGIKYVKRNFFAGRKFESLEQLNREFLRWCVEIADQRIHGTTHRKPAEAFREETLTPTAGHPRYVIAENLRRSVAADCLVSYKSNRYSVPPEHVGKMAELVIAQDRLKIYCNGELIAEHALSVGSFERIVEPKHYAGLRGKKREVQNLPESVSQFLGQVWPEVEVRALADYDLIEMGGAR